MKAKALVARVAVVLVFATFIAVMLPLIAPAPGIRVLATAGLPTVKEIEGLYSEAALLAADREIQRAYVTGVLDALVAVLAEGEAFAEAGLDPRNAYGVLFEAVTGVPKEISLEGLRTSILETVRTSPNDQSAALAIWRSLALNRCCWDR